MLDGLFAREDHSLLGLGWLQSDDDLYSLHSKVSRYWLPEVSPSSGTGDSQELLLEVPPTTNTITLGTIKGRIRDLPAELQGDGSDGHRECVIEKYRHLRNDRYYPEIFGKVASPWDLDHSIASGQAAGTMLDQYENNDGYPYTDRRRLWLDGVDSDLFSTDTSTSTPVDTDGDGTFDRVEFDQSVMLARPLPAGEYEFNTNEIWPIFKVCGHVSRGDWTVTVTPPEGTLHEFFFDPVTDGFFVKADSAHGVLDPTGFVGASGATSTVSRVSWGPSTRPEDGTVTVIVTGGPSPSEVLDEHIVDFIELDGSVSLSLDVTDPTVESKPPGAPREHWIHWFTWAVSS